MRIDIHTHIFPPEMAAARATCFDQEPAFRLLYDSPRAKLATAEDLLAMMDQEEVDQSVVFGFPWHSAARVQRHNDYILDACAKYPQRLIGFCCLDPLHAAAPAEAERCLNQGLRGIGELAFYASGIDHKILGALEPLMQLARDRNLPVMIHTNEPVGHAYPGKAPLTPLEIYTMIKRFAHNRIILAHWGGGIFFFNLLKKEVRDTLKNVYFDTAASPFLYEPEIYRVAIALAGRDKILWGSDYPLLKPGRYFKEMALAGLTEDEIAALCGNNASKLLHGAFRG